MTETETVSNKPDPTQAPSENQTSQNLLMAWQAISSDGRTSTEICKMLATFAGCSDVLLLSHDTENATLQYHGRFPPPPTAPPTIYINTFNAEEDSIVAALTKGNLISYERIPDDDRLGSLVGHIKQESATLLPLKIGDALIGLLALYNQPNTPLASKTIEQLTSVQTLITTLLQMTFEQEALQKRISDIEQESEIFSRIDEELNDNIDINYVLSMVKDWALRFTNADAAALALYDNQNETLRVMSQYGFNTGSLTINEDLPKDQGGIMLRVARRGSSEIVPNVEQDTDYYALADGIQTQMSVPIKREEHVIGILTLLSRTLNGFTEEHLEFTQRLANRAGVAVDNARLFSETTREREKLLYILRNIGDNVILVDLDHKIQMINSSSLLAFQLSADDTYVGKSLADVITHSKLQIAYQEAVENNDTVTEEIDLPNDKTYHTTIAYHQGIGRIIVMQDITYFKETDRLKTELVATVSHDLKQPLGVMRGYLDLLKMVNDFDDKSLRYIDNLNLAFFNMRQLIDDLLDLARIESGLTLELEQVSIGDVLQRASKNLQPQADIKQIDLALDLPESLQLITADPKRLEQIFNNLISNAIKYTPPEGKVKVRAELVQTTLRIFVEDNGMGIGAEDQAKIFERFYRVRRPETDSIEGTGLGLAIVKSLVEAHNGKIDFKSILGKGSTFRVTLPLEL